MSFVSATGAYTATQHVPEQLEKTIVEQFENDSVDEAIAIEATVELWLGRAKQLNLHEQGHFTRQIHEMAGEILNKLCTMYEMGNSPEQIKNVALRSIILLNTLAKESYERTESYQQLKKEEKKEFDRIDAKIRSAKPNFDAFVYTQEEQLGSPTSDSQPTARQLMAEDPMWADKQSRIYENIIVARIAACTVNMVSDAFVDVVDPPLKIVGRAIKYVVSTACQMNPTTEKGCQQVTEFGSEALQKTGIREFAKKTHDTYPRNVALKYELEKQFLIPQEEGEQYGKDAFIVATKGIPLGAAMPLFSATKRLLSTTKTFVKSDSGAGENIFSSRITESKNLTSSELKGLARKNHLAGLAKEKVAIENLIQRTPAIVLHPTGFPKHLNQFYAQCELHPFKISKLGESKKGIIDGHLLYHAGQDHILFVIKNSSVLLSKKLDGKVLMKSSELLWNERLGAILDTAVHFSKENGHKRVFFAWDVKEQPFAVILESRSKTVLGTSQLSTGIDYPPLTVVEISMSGVK